MVVLTFGELTRGSINSRRLFDFARAAYRRTSTLTPRHHSGWRLGLCGDGLPAAWFSPCWRFLRLHFSHRTSSATSIARSDARSVRAWSWCKGWALDPHADLEDRALGRRSVPARRGDVPARASTSSRRIPDWPGIHTARPGFMTGFSASRFPNGPHTVEMRVYTSNGDVHFLGRRTININNTDQPGAVRLRRHPGRRRRSTTPPAPSRSSAGPPTPTASTASRCSIDGGILQARDVRRSASGRRRDVPRLPGALFSGFVANIDTTRVQNGVHLLTVRAVDRQGMSQLIGRRQIQVINNDRFLKPFGYHRRAAARRRAVRHGCGDDDADVIGLAADRVRGAHHAGPRLGARPRHAPRHRPRRVRRAAGRRRALAHTTDDCGARCSARFANCYGLPRYDVARYYPNYPDAPRAGFLFTLDVGALMRLGVRPGNHT